MKLVLASRNRGKLAELQALLAGLPLRLHTADEFSDEEPVESACSFVENALIKARHCAAASGLPALADDSGLLVAGLGGRPGVLSARFAGAGASDAQNLDALLAACAQLSGDERLCRFVCVMALVRAADDPLPLISEGAWSGRLLRQRRGTGGFGYDPVFLDQDLGRSAAELSAEEKAARSHRAEALRGMRELIARKLVLA